MDLAGIEISDQELAAFCRKHHIRRLAFFGSGVRKDHTPDSDLDVLVEFEPEHIPGFDFFNIEAELARLLDKKIDLQTPNFLGPEIRKIALSEAVTAYEQA